MKRVLSELLQRIFANSACSADEDGDEARRKSGGDTRIRGLDTRESDH